MELILDEISEFIIDCEHKTAPIQETGYPSIRTPNIGKGVLVLEGVNRVSEETYKDWTKRGEPQEGDLIIAREAPVGNVALIPKNLKVCLGQRTVLVRPDNTKVNSQYLCYLLLGEELQGQILTKTTGSTVAHLNMKDIRELKIQNLPPLPIQTKIASILSAYDELIENNNQRIKLLEQMAEEIYKEWFVRLRFPGYETVKFFNEDGSEVKHGEVGGLPEGWEKQRIRQFGKVITGKTPSKNDDLNYDGEIPFIKTPDMQQGMFFVQTEEKLSEKGANSQQSQFIPKNTISVSCIGTVGKVSITTKMSQTNQQINSLIPKKEFHLEFLYFSLLKLKPTIESFAATGATMSNLSKSKFENLKIIKPSDLLISEFNEITNSSFEEIKILMQKNQLLQQTRDLLLPRLISGKLSVEHLVEEVVHLPMAAEPEVKYKE